MARNHKAHGRALRRQVLHCGRKLLCVQCRRAVIAALCQEPFQGQANAWVDHDRDSRCARNSSRADPADVPIRLVLLVRVDQVVDRAEPERRIVPTDKDQELCRPEHDQDRAYPGAPQCCRRCQTECRLKRSRASRCTHASRNNGSVRWRTSESRKASASSIQRASGREPVDAERLRRSLRLRNRAHHGK